MLTAIYPIKKKSNNKKHIYYYWHCECDCGKEKDINTYQLKSGQTKSCGCLRDKKLSERSKKYNRYDLTGEYGIGYTLNGIEFARSKERYYTNITLLDNGNLVAGEITEKCAYIFNGYNLADKARTKCNFTENKYFTNFVSYIQYFNSKVTHSNCFLKSKNIIF